MYTTRKKQYVTGINTVLSDINTVTCKKRRNIQPESTQIIGLQTSVKTNSWKILRPDNDVSQ